MAQQVEVDDSAVAGVVIPEESTHELLSDVAYRRLALVNIVFVGQRLTGARNWVLIRPVLRGPANASISMRGWGKFAQPPAA
ncbi:MAG: hypothetical protein J0I15_00115 [Herbaspirillum huttiense]|uniref:hypothetical protein n=1 Tax=Herbaspirillum huttiense TaxID=863372 RepID=UPI001ACB57AB|nr:hypothetical protein [Herbaspirillum huttiense]